MSLDAYRNQIDQIDDKLLALLERRKLVCGMINKIKKKKDIPIEDNEREEEILTTLRKKSRKLSKDNLHDLYHVIFSMSKK